MRRIICQSLLILAGACLVWQVTLTGVDVDRAGRVLTILGSVIGLALLPRLLLQMRRWLRPLLILVGFVLAVLAIVAVLQNEQLRQAIRDLMAYLGTALGKILEIGSPLPLVIAMMALITFGVLCARTPSSST